MKNLVIVACLTLFFALGCQRWETEFSQTLHEDAVVADAIYTPSRHDTQVGLTAIKTGPMGMDFDGNLGIRIGGGLQVSQNTVPEKFAVVFKCQHGHFIIERKELYEEFKNHVGDTVDVSYREVYKTEYKKDEKGKKQVVSRSLIDYDFLTAKLK